MQTAQSQAVSYFVGAAFLVLVRQCVESVSGFSRNGANNTSQGTLTDRYVFPYLEDGPTNEPFGSSPLQTGTSPLEQLISDGPLGEATGILPFSPGGDKTHKSALQGRLTKLNRNDLSTAFPELTTEPFKAASSVSKAPSVSAAFAYGISGSQRQMTQEIGLHKFDASGGANRGGRTLLDEKRGTDATPSSSPSVFTWNPLNADGEPTEAKSLEHVGVPDDFVGIPILDNAAEQQKEQSKDAAAAAEEPSSGRYDNSARSSNNTAASGRGRQEGQHDSNGGISSGKYQRLLERGVAESRNNPPSAAGSSSTYSEDSDQPRPVAKSLKHPTASQAPDAATLGESAPKSESGSFERGSTTDLNNYNTTLGGVRSSNGSINNGSSSSSTTGPDTHSQAGWTGHNSQQHDDAVRVYVGGSDGRSRFVSSSGLTGASEDVSSSSWEPIVPWSRWDSGKAARREAKEALGRKTECVLEVGGVRVDASYVDSACTGPISVAYQKKQGKFMERRLLLGNKTEQPLTVVMKTVNAKFNASPSSYNRSYRRDYSGPASFLQGQEGNDTNSTTAAAAGAKAADYVTDMLNRMRKHRRKHPGLPLDLVVCFASPLDGNSEEKRTATEGEPVSFMQTSAGAARIVQTCEELLSVLEESKGFSCEILEAVDIVILQFPPAADLSDEGEVHKVLCKLLFLEGKDILFFELAKPTSLQMVPVEEELPEPPKGLVERWAFVQAKEALKEQCSAEAMTKIRLLSDGEDSPVSAHLPEDPDLEKRLWGMYSSRCVHAWLHGEKGHKGVVVAVIDSGVANHSDLNENIWHNPRETIDGRDDDNDGFIDDVEGWNFANDSNHVVDANGHGTHVAGTVGGVANKRDIVGCAPLVSIMKIQQFGSSGTGSIGDAVRGMAYAMLKGVSIINNSWGATETTAALQVLIERSQYMRGGLGILIVNAAGNSSSNNDVQPFYPAGFDYENTISVGAYDAEGNLASFSNYGKNSVSVLAPGDRIYSTYLDEGFAFLSGTSMAAPHVSGVGALVFGVFRKANSDVTAAEVKDIIKVTVQPLEAAKQTTQWGGAVDAAAAVLMARMGGMWMQMKCTDMIVDLEPHEEYASTLYLRGYAEGNYRADIKVEVYDQKGNLLDSAMIPITLSSSLAPEANKPSDAEAANAFSSYAKERDHQTPLCAVQLGYKGSLEEEGWSVLQIAAVSLGCVAGVLLLAIGGFFLYSRLYAHRVSQSIGS